MKKDEKNKIIVTKNGPYKVEGDLPLREEFIVGDNEGIPEHWEAGQEIKKQKNINYLCRCGKTKTPPFCDGSHIKANFDGTETASKKKYDEMAVKYEGAELVLKDVDELCALGRFCERAGNVWNLTTQKNDKESIATAIKEACDCPSGRLVMVEKKTGQEIEPTLEPSIGVVEDEPGEVSGPYWVKGGVQIESESGQKYEKRNRCTICRCGKSENKPFCDGTHYEINYKIGQDNNL